MRHTQHDEFGRGVAGVLTPLLILTQCLNQVIVIGDKVSVFGEREARARGEAAHRTAAVVGVHREAVGGLRARGLSLRVVVIAVAIGAAAAVVFELGGVGVETVGGLGSRSDEGFIVPTGARGGEGSS